MVIINREYSFRKGKYLCTADLHANESIVNFAEFKPVKMRSTVQRNSRIEGLKSLDWLSLQCLHYAIVLGEIKRGCFFALTMPTIEWAPKFGQIRSSSFILFAKFALF